MNYIKETGIPIPAIATVRRGVTEIIKTLEVGESFVMDLKKRATASVAASRAKIKITTKAISDTEVRVWRTE